jgi:signal transduction histidine kinase/HPt (histidine-containing phosphotransfer) domain-containing protein/DNA-binding NarL/FixJ family response regulator
MAGKSPGRLRATPSAGSDPLLPDAVRSVFAHTPASLVGNLLGAVVLLLLFSSAAPQRALAGWGALFIAVWGFRAAVARRFAWAQPASAEAFVRWDRLWSAGTLASGAAWGGAAWLFWGHGGSLQQIGLLLILYSYCVGAIPLLASRFRLLLAFCAAAFVPAVGRIAMEGTPASLGLAGIIVLIFGMTVLMGRNFRHAFDTVIRLKVHNENLVGQLGAEKAAAEAARQQAEAARELAEAANRSKSDFFATASHELRTPLTGMLGVVDLLRREEGHSPRTRHLLDVAAASGDALLTLVNDLLDLAKIEAGRFEITPVDADLQQVLLRSLEPLRLRAQDKGVAFHVEWQPGLPAAWRVDAGRVRQILLNLVSNAVKFTEQGSVAVAVGGRPLAQGDEEGGWELTLAVGDTGIGIAPEALGRLFENFVQADASIGRRFGGTGLGLSISRQMAQLMGGDIGVSSELGQGTCFTVKLRAQPAQSVVPAPGDEDLLPHRHRLHVLLADDNPTNRLIFTEYLDAWGHEVTSVEDGAQALVACTMRRFDLLLLDGRMPVMGGPEALERIRATPPGEVCDAQVYVAAISANTAADDRAGFERAGAQAFIVKPVHAPLLHAVIQRAIDYQLARGVELAPARPADAPMERVDRGALERLLDLGAPAPRQDTPSEQDRARRLQDSFMRELPEHARRLRSALQEGRLAELAEVAHAMKGASVYVELPALTQLADQAEQHAREGRVQAALASARALQRWIDEVDHNRETMA